MELLRQATQRRDTGTHSGLTSHPAFVPAARASAVRRSQRRRSIQSDCGPILLLFFRHLPSHKREFKIFVSCPGDVEAERRIVEEVVAEISGGSLAATLNFVCLTISWRRDVVSSIHQSAQHSIDEQLPDYDIYLGIMSSRFGRRTGKAGSGTAHEFNAALSARAETGRPWIMFFFKDSRHLSVTDLEDPAARKQLKGVLAFRERVQKKGLSKSYKTRKDFRSAVKHDLDETLRMLSASPSRDGGGMATGPRDQFLEVAKDYTQKFALSKTNERFVELNCRAADGSPSGRLDNALTNLIGKQGKSVLVLGEFGSGKTTAALHYVYKLAEEWLVKGPGARLPLLLRLREYRDGESIEDWILDQLAKSRTSAG